jgi:hypothetical protein
MKSRRAGMGNPGYVKLQTSEMFLLMNRLMFKTIWPAAAFVMCVVVIGYGANQTSPPSGNRLTRISDTSSGEGVTSASVEGNSRSISIITEKPYTRRFL